MQIDPLELLVVVLLLWPLESLPFVYPFPSGFRFRYLIDDWLRLLIQSLESLDLGFDDVVPFLF